MGGAPSQSAEAGDKGTLDTAAWDPGKDFPFPVLASSPAGSKCEPSAAWMLAWRRWCSWPPAQDKQTSCCSVMSPTRPPRPTGSSRPLHGRHLVPGSRREGQ